MSQPDLIARIRLIRSQSIGPITFCQLLTRFGTAEAALKTVPDLAARGGGRRPALCTEEQAVRELAQVEALGGRYSALVKGSILRCWRKATMRRRSSPPLVT